ncbi:MAG: PstS family phosphate ABC transporter substrate-binding protein [Planctomycetes bacterium]|nr:PstS family phosphate ABC transporter substrate-binding protein [Planctomycetota bacterium]
MRTRFTLLTATAIALLSVAASAPQSGSQLATLKGEIRVDGSSTVYPITEAVAEDFSKAAKGVRTTVGVSGTGGGFKRFCKGETDISDASRPITKSEAETCKGANIEFVELPVAYDGLCIAISKQNTWATKLTLDQIRKIYSASGTAKTWKDLDSAWPDRAIKVYSPGTDSGTFDYFKEVTVGKDGKVRSDMSVSEDDNVLVNGVAGDRDAIGYFGFAYYVENKDKLVAVAVDSGKGAVLPSDATILDGSYEPFSRPVFIYVNRKSADRPEVGAFVDFYLQQAAALSKEVGYTPLPESIYGTARTNWKARRTGTQFLDAKGDKVSGSLANVYK